MTFSVCGHGTHVGNVRTNNEDNYSVDPENGFGILADGMGGHKGGEVASQIVVDCVSAEVRVGKPMADAFIRAHRAVLEASEKGKGHKGMGSTAVAIKLDTEKYEIAWVGDSRAYCWDGEQLIQVSKDHSLVQSMVDEGFITAAEASVHPKRNYLTQSLGMPEIQTMKVGRVQGSLYQHYQFLLCSDGLSGEIANSEIADVFRRDISEQKKTDLLIRKAVEKGGADNITVVLFSAPETAPVIDLKEVRS